MSADVRDTLESKLYSCDRHVDKIIIAKKHLQFIFPLDVNNIDKLKDTDASFLDQLIFRFTKLQDTMGENLFSLILKASMEDVKKMTFIDILNRMEELDLVERSQWQFLREIRNELAHEYSDNKEEIAYGINQVYEKSEELIDIYKKIKTFCKERIIGELS